LVGLPNAGKSSLLARLTRAAPKVAGYPFTTTEPVLGTLEADERQIVLADIPGLIEGAAEGAGLGHEFLAHVERCSLLVHLVELAPPVGDPAANYEAVRGELASYGAGLEQLPELVVLSKVDLIDAEEADRVAAQVRERMSPGGGEPIAVSSVTGAGLDQLRRRIVAELPTEDRTGPAVRGHAPGFEVEHRVYRPEGEGGYRIEREEDGAFRVVGRGVEMLIERHDLSNQEALSYLEQRLTEIGVLAALRNAGFEAGDEVRIGEHEFELHPG
jgi:GTPase